MAWIDSKDWIFSLNVVNTFSLVSHSTVCWQEFYTGRILSKLNVWRVLAERKCAWVLAVVFACMHVYFPVVLCDRVTVVYLWMYSVWVSNLTLIITISAFLFFLCLFGCRCLLHRPFCLHQICESPCCCSSFVLLPGTRSWIPGSTSSSVVPCWSGSVPAWTGLAWTSPAASTHLYATLWADSLVTL